MISSFQLNFTISTVLYHFNWISTCQLNFNISTEFHHFNWISSFQLNFNWNSPFQLKFTSSTGYHHFYRISHFKPNFTIWTKFHNCNWISQFQQNATISSEFHSYERIALLWPKLHNFDQNSTIPTKISHFLQRFWHANNRWQLCIEFLCIEYVYKFSVHRKMRVYLIKENIEV